jgi:hypothetical protein
MGTTEKYCRLFGNHVQEVCLAEMLKMAKEMIFNTIKDNPRSVAHFIFASMLDGSYQRSITGFQIYRVGGEKVNDALVNRWNKNCFVETCGLIEGRRLESKVGD